MIYLLNSPILTSYGNYEFTPISVDVAKTITKTEKWVSTIGHESTAQVLSKLLDIDIQANRIMVEMKPGDKAIVFRLLERLPEGKILDSQELQNAKYELGLLVMVK